MLIFLHIPKTAGSTFRKICVRQFSKKEKIDLGAAVRTERPRVRDMNAFYSLVRGAAERLSKEEENKVLFVLQGHAGYGLHEFFTQPARYVTFLRNPVHRVISHYLHALRSPNYSERDRLLKVGLIGYVTEERFKDAVDNVQTRLICGERGIPKKGILTNRDFEEAKRRLEEKFDVVGLTERFDESLILARRVLGWRNVYYHRWNVSIHKSNIDSLSRRIIGLVKEKNIFDQAIYDYACNLFEQKIEEYGRETFVRDLKSFKTRNRIFGKLYLLKLALTSSPRAYLRKVRTVASAIGAVFRERAIDDNQ